MLRRVLGGTGGRAVGGGSDEGRDIGMEVLPDTSDAYVDNKVVPEGEGTSLLLGDSSALTISSLGLKSLHFLGVGIEPDVALFFFSRPTFLELIAVRLGSRKPGGVGGTEERVLGRISGGTGGGRGLNIVGEADEEIVCGGEGDCLVLPYSSLCSVICLTLHEGIGGD